MKKSTLCCLLAAIVFLSSCAVQQKWCPSQDPHFFYRSQGLKKPKAVLLNERGYSRPKLKNKY